MSRSPQCETGGTLELAACSAAHMVYQTKIVQSWDTRVLYEGLSYTPIPYFPEVPARARRAAKGTNFFPA